MLFLVSEETRRITKLISRNASHVNTYNPKEVQAFPHSGYIPYAPQIHSALLDLKTFSDDVSSSQRPFLR
jgi:hypothetical protein